MWVKILGLLCAGVFVGAVIVEAKQLTSRQPGEAEDEETDEDASAAPAAQGADDTGTTHS